MIAHIILALAGLALLTVAADHLVLGSSRVATRLRVSPVVVGVIIIGLGTSAPELLVSGVAAARGDTGIALGTLTGSNILNVTLILGFAALVARLAVGSAVIRREVPLATAAVMAFGLLAFVGLTARAAVALTACLGVATWLLLRWAAHGRNLQLAKDVTLFADPVDSTSNLATRPTGGAQRELPGRFEPIRAVLALAGVLGGAEVLVTNASAIAEHLGVSQLIIGFTVVALGTSLPELVTTIQAMRRGETDLVVGNVFGSNLFNSLAGGAIIAYAAPADHNTSIGAAIAVAMILTSALAWALLRRGLALTRIEGVVLLAAYGLTMPLLLAA
jgi:cation:H+ antiporter